MSLLVTLWNDWFLSVICLGVAALVPIVYGYLKYTTRSPVFLDPFIFKELPLIDKRVLSYNTRLFRWVGLDLPSGQQAPDKITGSLVPSLCHADSDCQRSTLFSAYPSASTSPSKHRIPTAKTSLDLTPQPQMMTLLDTWTLSSKYILRAKCLNTLTSLRLDKPCCSRAQRVGTPMKQEA